MDEGEVRRFRRQVKLLYWRLRRETPPLAGLSRTEQSVLAALVRLPDGSGPRQVADELWMTSSNVAAALRVLEEAGLVVRRRDPGDARRVLIEVTASGAGLVATARGERDGWFGRAIESTLDPEERRQLLAAGELFERLAAFDDPDADAEAR
jgi:DNA-binding MarR family transcriptional regulator